MVKGTCRYTAEYFPDKTRGCQKLPFEKGKEDELQ